MTESDLARIYEEIVAAHQPATRDACIAPELLLGAVEHRLREADQIAVINHAFTCPACRADLELLRSVAVARRPLRPRLSVATGLFAAAAVVIVAISLVIGRGKQPTPDDVLRGDRSLPVLVGPRGTVAGGEITLVWRPVAGAASYDVTVATEGGVRVYQTSTRDTTIALPIRTAVSPGDYYWFVRVKMPDASERATVPIPFHRAAP